MRNMTMTGKELKQLREVKKITQGGLARALGLETTTIYRWETAPDSKHNIKISKRNEIAIRFVLDN